ncbi:tetratricopeptide repeat protein [Actinophytocola xanthii]|uniref:tetratricopeptide repeat protein n=1 Tax=Actinophytocola xanthii TaxID=1912961 RepID=UPI001E3E575B|nr:tetratricopeptide repeat protein [Actinophytocola xanthii]
MLRLVDRGPLDLSVGDVSVAPALNASYDELGPIAMRLYRLLPLHPGPEFTVEPVAEGLNEPVDVTTQAVSELLDANLITEIQYGRFRQHDLLREHARARAEELDPQPERNGALYRMCEWYGKKAAAADLAINPRPRRFSWVYLDVYDMQFPDRRDALEWFTREWANVLEAQRSAAGQDGWDELVFLLAETVWNGLRSLSAWDELAESQRLGAEAARRRSHVLESVCLSRLGFAETALGNDTAAEEACTQAVRRASELGDWWAEAAALSTRARARTARGECHGALADLERAVRLDEELGDRRSIALRHRRIGEIYCRPKMADFDRAIRHLRLAKDVMREVDDEIGLARAVTYLAKAHLGAGQWGTAVCEMGAVIDVLRSFGAPAYLVDVYAILGEARARLGHVAQARACFTEAIELGEAAGLHRSAALERARCYAMSWITATAGRRTPSDRTSRLDERDQYSGAALIAANEQILPTRPEHSNREGHDGHTQGRERPPTHREASAIDRP